MNVTTRIVWVVRYLYPGTIVTEEMTVELDIDPDSSVEEAEDRAAQVAHAENCFAYQVVKMEKAEGGWVRDSRVLEKFGTVYPDGMIFNATQVKAMDDQRTLAKNMEYNDWTHVVQTRRGNFQPFDPRADRVV